jgi:membrane associated rhomboid family serine protease
MEPIAARLTPTIKALVVISATLFSFYVFVPASHPLLAHLALGPGVFHGELWQVFTAMFVQFDVLAFVFGLIGLWFVGAYIEHTQGARRFLTLFLSAGILANVAIGLVARLIGAPLVSDGYSLAVLALFVAFGRIQGRTQVLVLPSLGFQARHVAMFWVGWSILACVIGASWAGLAGVLVASAVGYLLAAPGGLRQLYDSFRARRLRQRYRVIDGGAPRRARNRSQKDWN